MSVRRLHLAVAAALGALWIVTTLTAAGQAQARTLGVAQRRTPLVIGHRGAAAYRPEHTSASYALAAQMGADYLEPDLVPSKDGVLVDRHEPNLRATTDVAAHPEFASRRTTKVINGSRQTGWFTTDFTWAELKTLRTVERIPLIRPQNATYDGRYRILSFRDDILWAQHLAVRYGRHIGLIPEIKYSTYFTRLRLAMEQHVLDYIQRYDTVDGHLVAPMIIQSAETTNLRWLHRHTRIPLMQLTGPHGAPADLLAKYDPTTWADLTAPRGLAVVATYARYVGATFEQLVPADASGHLDTPTSLVADAHAAGLGLVDYTVRAENLFLPLDFRIGSNPTAPGDAAAQCRLLFDLGVDGLFTDNPDIAVTARADWITAGRPGA